MTQRPLKLKVPEDQFLRELVQFMAERIDVPDDGKWRSISLVFELKNSGNDDTQGGGFMFRSDDHAG